MARRPTQTNNGTLRLSALLDAIISFLSDAKNSAYTITHGKVFLVGLLLAGAMP